MSYDATPDMPHINADARYICTECGHEFHTGVHLKCPSCGSHQRFNGPAADEPDTTCEAQVSRRGRRASVMEATSEGHRMHLEEAQHVRDTEAHIRSLVAMPDPDSVIDRDSFLAFVAALSKSRGKRPDAWKNTTPEALLSAAALWAQSGPPGGQLPAVPSWRDFARFLLAGATS